MNKKSKAGSHYQNLSLETASPGKLILMLYDGALRFLSTAKKGFKEDSIGGSNEIINNNIVRAQNILYELKAVLDHDVESEGDFSKKMDSLYDYMIELLNKANIKKDPAPITEVQTHLTEIRNAWAEMLKKSEKSKVEDAGLSCSA